VARTGPPHHLCPCGVVQKAELDRGAAAKLFPFDYLQQKSTDSVANQNGNQEDLSPHLL
jgi:hypothetical protein